MLVSQPNTIEFKETTGNFSQYLAKGIHFNLDTASIWASNGFAQWRLKGFNFSSSLWNNCLLFSFINYSSTYSLKIETTTGFARPILVDGTLGPQFQADGQFRSISFGATDAVEIKVAGFMPVINGGSTPVGFFKRIHIVTLQTIFSLRLAVSDYIIEFILPQNYLTKLPPLLNAETVHLGQCKRLKESQLNLPKCRDFNAFFDNSKEQIVIKLDPNNVTSIVTGSIEPVNLTLDVSSLNNLSTLYLTNISNANALNGFNLTNASIIYLYDCPNLSIDLTATYPNLQELVLKDAKIEAFNLTAPNLFSLYLESNITFNDLDLSSFPNLNYLTLIKFTANSLTLPNNFFSSIEINSVNVPYINLSNFNLNQVIIRSPAIIDLSNTQITDLMIGKVLNTTLSISANMATIEECPALTSLNFIANNECALYLAHFPELNVTVSGPESAYIYTDSLKDSNLTITSSSPTILNCFGLTQEAELTLSGTFTKVVASNLKKVTGSITVSPQEFNLNLINEVGLSISGNCSEVIINQSESVNVNLLTECLSYNFMQCNLTSAQVDALIIKIAELAADYNLESGYLFVSQNQARTSASDTAYNYLINKFWTIEE